MLSPETINFPTPRHKISVEKLSSTGSNQNLSKSLSEISNHYFNHSVTVVLPETILVPEDLNCALVNDNIYYKVDKLSIKEIIKKQFIDSFITVGVLTAISLNTHIDTDNCAAVTPSGCLVLNLLKETFQLLGLEGRQSQFSTKRYVVEIDLKNSSFNPGKKNYERVLKCLSEFVDLQMDFLIVWEPPVTSDIKRQICPSSVAAHLDAQGYAVSSCEPCVMSNRLYGLPIASLPSTNKVEDHFELLEWVGAVALGVDMSCADEESQYLSSYSGPLDAEQETQAAVLKHTGFFTITQIQSFFKSLTLYFERRKDIPWAAMHVQGFSDSPVSWKLQEHTFHADGDNSYTFFLQADSPPRIVKHSSFAKKNKLKLI